RDNNTVKLALPLREFSVDGPHACDIRRVVAIVRGKVHQYKITASQRVGVVEVVSIPRILAATDNRTVAFKARPAHQVMKSRYRSKLVFEHPGFSRFHRLE